MKRFVPPPRRDWFRLLTDLSHAGCNNQDVAAILGVAKNTVYHWKMGADPGHSLGEALLLLHRRKCAKRKPRRGGPAAPRDVA
jgi:hypothetical protein